MNNFQVSLGTTATRGKVVSITTGSGVVKRRVRLVGWSNPRLRPTHNRTTQFSYQRGVDIEGNVYETKSRGGGWRPANAA